MFCVTEARGNLLLRHPLQHSMICPHFRSKDSPTLALSRTRYETLLSSLKCNANDRLSGTVPPNQSSALAGVARGASPRAHAQGGFPGPTSYMETEGTRSCFSPIRQKRPLTRNDCNFALSTFWQIITAKLDFK